MSRVEQGLHRALDLLLHRRFPVAASSFSGSGVQRILVVRKDNIGDLLCTTPALRALRRALPEAFLAVLVPAHCRPVVERNPDVDAIYTYTKAKHRSEGLGLPALWDLGRVLRALRARRFDLAIVMGRPCSRSAGWLAYASGAPWRLGYRTDKLHPLGFFLNLAQDPGRMTSHEVDGCLELLSAIGIPPAGRELTLIPDPEAQEAIRQRLAEERVEDAESVALLHISSRRETNRWPLAAFAQLADLLQDRLGLRIVLSWAPGDARNPLFPGDDDKAEEVARLMRVRPILLRTPKLDDLIATLSLSDFALSSDGGFMHIAAALGIPQVALFGRAGATHWAPVSTRCAVLQRDHDVDRIPVEEVLGAATAVISRWVGGGEGSLQGSKRASPV